MVPIHGRAFGSQEGEMAMKNIPRFTAVQFCSWGGQMSPQQYADMVNARISEWIESAPVVNGMRNMT